MPKRILIIKPSSLGDIVHALPTLAALRDRFSDSWIAWLVKQEYAEILEGNPALDEIIPSNLHLRHWPSLVQKIRRGAFDLVIDLQGLFRSGLLARLSGAKERVGFSNGREGSPWFYTKRVCLPISLNKPWRLLDMHAVDRNLTVAKALGANVPHKNQPLVSLSDRDKIDIDEWLCSSSVNPNDRLIAIAPLARLSIKCWPLDRFIDAGRMLSDILGCRIVLVGGNSEKWVVDRFRSVLHEKLVDLIGKTNLKQLVVLLSRVNLLIANDSAPLHLAVAVGTPALALMGPTHSGATGPYGYGDDCILQTSLPCSPCGQRSCQNPRYLECLTSITTDHVVDSAMRILSKNRCFV